MPMASGGSFESPLKKSEDYPQEVLDLCMFRQYRDYNEELENDEDEDSR